MSIAIAICLIALVAHKPVLFTSTSPHGEYELTIQAWRGVSLLNAPEHLKISVKKRGTLRQRTIYTEIHNDDIPLDPEYNIGISWEDEKLNIMLRGTEQPPEIIVVFLNEDFIYEQYQNWERQGNGLA